MYARSKLVALVFALVFMVVFGVSSVVQAQLSEENASWAEGPAKFLMTKDEIREWKDITTDAEAKHFIDLFWARRDPNLDSPLNEFKAEFDGRVGYADENFSYDDFLGSMTDRGKVLIQLGIPHQAERRGPTETVQSAFDSGNGSDEVRSNAEMWTYDPKRLPESFSMKGTHILFVFYEQKTASNNFVLDRSHKDATIAMRTMKKAPEALLLHPDLLQVPKPVSVPGGEPATPDQLAWLIAGKGVYNDQAIVFAESGVADASHRPLWLHLELPKDAPALDTLVGRVFDSRGDVLSNFQIAATANAPGSPVYHLTFPVAVGAYVLEIAGAAGGVPQVVAKLEHEIEAIPLEGTWLSPLWTGLSAERDDNAPLGLAFTFGGWHLSPLTAETISKNNQLSYFGFVVRPGLGPDGAPNLKAKIVLKKDGQRMGSPLRLDLGTVKVTGDLYLYANALDLSRFPAPGDFTLEFTIEDFVSKIKVKDDVVVALTE